MSRLLWSCATVLLFAAPARAQAVPLAQQTQAPAIPSGHSGAPASGAVDREYQRIVAEAVAEHQAGHWAEARALFLRAHARRPSARTFRTLGMTAFELREYPDAVRELSAALSDPRSALGDVHRKQVEELLARSEVFVGRYQVRLEPADADVRVDGVSVKLELDGSLLLAVGRRELDVQAAGHVAERRTVLVDGRDGELLAFSLRPIEARGLAGERNVEARGLAGERNVEARAFADGRTSELSAGASSATFVPGQDPRTAGADQGPAASPMKNDDARPLSARVLHDYVWTWSAAGGALLLGASSLALHRRTLHEDDALAKTCSGDCDPMDGKTRARDDLRLWSRVTLGASVAFAASAVVLYAIEHRASVRRVLRSVARPARFGLAAGYASDCRMGSKP